MDFTTWLIESRKLTARSARDVSSRLKRALSLLEVEEATSNSVNNLEENEKFQALTMTVRSQLRRSIRLYCEYKQQ